MTDILDLMREAGLKASEALFAAVREMDSLNNEIKNLRVGMLHIHDVLSVEHLALQRAEVLIAAARGMWDRMGDDQCPSDTVAAAEAVFETALAVWDKGDDRDMSDLVIMEGSPPERRSPRELEREIIDR